MIETTAGRVSFNEIVPDEAGYINELLTKKALRDIIGEVLKVRGIARTANFLDDIKDLGLQWPLKVVYRSTLEMLLFHQKKNFS